MEKQSVLLNTALVPMATFIAWLGLDGEKIAILAALMAIDLLAGMAKAVKMGDDVTSRRLTAGVLAKVVVLTVPFVIALAARGVELDIHWLVAWALSALIVSEAYSIVGNIHTIKTGVQVREIDALSHIVKTVRRILENLLRVEK